MFYISLTYLPQFANQKLTAYERANGVYKIVSQNVEILQCEKFSEHNIHIFRPPWVLSYAVSFVLISSTLRENKSKCHIYVTIVQQFPQALYPWQPPRWINCAACNKHSDILHVSKKIKTQYGILRGEEGEGGVIPLSERPLCSIHTFITCISLSLPIINTFHWLRAAHSSLNSLNPILPL